MLLTLRASSFRLAHKCAAKSRFVTQVEMGLAVLAICELDSIHLTCIFSIPGRLGGVVFLIPTILTLGFWINSAIAARVKAEKSKSGLRFKNAEICASSSILNLTVLVFTPNS